MKCMECGHDQLFAEVRIRKIVPFADKGGSVRLGGHNITQAEIKKTWDEDETGAERGIRGPVTCPECGCEHYYIKGEGKDAGLRKGRYDDVVAGST